MSFMYKQWVKDTHAHAHAHTDMRLIKRDYMLELPLLRNIIKKLQLFSPPPKTSLRTWNTG